MNVFHVVALTGLISLACGMLVVNLVPTPRAGQAGTIMATFGVILLAALVLRQLLS